jgi:hypothetical protein
VIVENLLLPGVVIPGASAAAALWLTSLADRRGRPSSAVGGALAVGVAFLSAFVAMTGWPRFPPVESTQRLFYLVALATAVGFVLGWLRQQKAPWWVRGAVVGLLLSLMLRAPLEHTWARGEAVLWLAALFALGLGFTWAFEASCRPAGGRSDLVAAAVRLALLGAAAVLLGLSGTARLAQLMGALACGVLVLELLARRLGRRPWLPADAMVPATAAFGLLLGGYFYASLEPWPAILLALAFVLLGVGVDRAAGWRCLPLVPLALAVALVVSAFLAREEDPYDYYGCLGVDRGAIVTVQADGNPETRGA